MVSTEQLKPTKNPRQAWLLIALVLGISAFFGLVIVPYIRPKPAQMKGRAPDFVLPVIVNGDPGSRLKLSDLVGKAVVLDFWASWCEPCREQAPIIDSVARENKGKDVIFAGVNTGDQREPAVRFAQSRGLGYPVVFDPDGKVADAYKVQTLPTLVVINRAGDIIAVHHGILSAHQLEQLTLQAMQL